VCYYVAAPRVATITTQQYQLVIAKHPGFAVVEKKIAKKEGIPMKNAGAILASSSRGASKAAKKANPRLKRVKK
jgi:hypothetical protein